MNNIDDLLAVLRDAEKRGEEIAPAKLLAQVEHEQDPLRNFGDICRSNALFQALDNEFEFIRGGRSGLSNDEQERFAGLIRWLICGLRNWRSKDDPQRGRLVSLFVVLRFCDWDDNLLRAFPNDIADNTEIIQVLEEIVKRFNTEFRSRNTDTTPIWEKEAVDSFKQADAQCDWVTIAEKWKLFENSFFPHTLQASIVQYLYRYSFERLAGALNTCRQTPVAMQVAAVLSVEQRLRLAKSTANPFIQFACAYQTFSGRSKLCSLSLSAQQLLTELLLKVSNEGVRWKAWMQIFNRYPLRYPTLQVALGQALIAAPEAAVHAYVDSIDLHATPVKPEESRRCVANCLRVVREKATQDRRRSLWTYAHQRWQSWGFDEAKRDSHLLQINWSELDYAVVAYAVECMNADERTKATEAITMELDLLDNKWHESPSHCITSWNGLLSQLQPYAHANHAMATGADWLTESQTYRPFHPVSSVDDYLNMMFETS